MRLTEYEAKELLKSAGVAVSFGSLHASMDNAPEVFSFPMFLKAQTLAGNRGLDELVVQVSSRQELQSAWQILRDRASAANFSLVAVESAISFTEQRYLSIGYDTRFRSAVIRYSAIGGGGMDERGGTLKVTPVSATQQSVHEFLPAPELTQLVNQLVAVFFEHDATLLEINPVVQTPDGWLCLDAKMEVENVAQFRHPEWEQFGERSDLGRPPTEREQQAHQVSNSDHRGVAGESFFEFPGGEIGVMASGGGASTLAMDALLAEGLKPANYTEYSGNPTREKVAALAQVVLSIPNLKGLYVVGSNANFTDIYETLAGVIDGFESSAYVQQDGFAIVIRRGGPRWQEAFEMVQERLAPYPINYRLFGPEYSLVATARDIKELIAESSNK